MADLGRRQHELDGHGCQGRRLRAGPVWACCDRVDGAILVGHVGYPRVLLRINEEGAINLGVSDEYPVMIRWSHAR